MKSHLIHEYLPARLQYYWDDRTGYARHNFSHDVHGFALWEASRHREEQLLDMLSGAFKILKTYEVHWSSKHVASNFNRLYGRNPADTSSRHERVGEGPFLYVVVEDPRGQYIYWKNISGRVEITNESVAHLKPRLRHMVQSDFRYNIHSSNSLEEFARDATLILGPEESSLLLKRISQDGVEAPDLTTWRADLAGAGGWESILQLFQTLARTQPFCILRNVEDAMKPIPAKEGDIDILCNNAIQLASEMNADGASYLNPNSHFYTNVAGLRVHFDLREVGDGDIDGAWQRQILSSVDAMNYPYLVPSSPNRFFYLLYHTVLHKGYIKDSHVKSLRDGASQLGISTALGDLGNRPTDGARDVIRGFLKASQYRITHPRWPGVQLQREQVMQVGSSLASSHSGTRREGYRRLCRGLKRLVRRIPIVGPSLARARRLIRGRD